VILLLTLLLSSAVFSSAMREDPRSGLTKAAGATVLAALLLFALSLAFDGTYALVFNFGAVAVAVSAFGLTIWELVAFTAWRDAASSRS